MQWLNYHGEIVPAENFRLAADNRAMRYGDGVFESIRIMYGQPLWLGWHFDRLQYGLRALGIKQPFLFDHFALQIQELLEANKVRQGARLRVQLWRTDGGFYTPLNDQASWTMQLEALPQNAFTLNYKGLIVGEARRPKNALFVPDIKSSNGLQYVLAGREARDAGWDDALLYHPEGALLESSNSNIFVLRDGVLRTPALDGGCLPGIMRRVFLEMLPAVGYQVKEQILSHADLQAAEEVYLTNAIQGLRWVGGWKNKRYFRKQAVALNEALNQLAVNSLTN